MLIFPGIFREIDLWEKYVVRRSLDMTGRPPSWMPEELKTATGYVPGLSWRNFTRTDDATGLLVRGEPDEIFLMNGGSWSHLVDWKTARYTEGQRTFGLQYVAQVNFYRWIAEVHPIPPINEQSLIYCEPPDTKLTPDVLSEDQLVLPLTPHLIPVEADVTKYVRNVLDEAAELITRTDAPASHPDCVDCKTYDDLSGWAYPA